ncbi:unnamed protein product [Moneuplotes crassus]|uniref:Uncharacterized protein n=1 Tax=Euplotes crassus TaxID=5936 RepID=A0AAD1Y5M2_EUPCR|nr:unnamed protein product [Moneuplotes crassus]
MDPAYVSDEDMEYNSVSSNETDAHQDPHEPFIFNKLLYDNKKSSVSPQEIHDKFDLDKPSEATDFIARKSTADTRSQSLEANASDTEMEDISPNEPTWSDQSIPHAGSQTQDTNDHTMSSSEEIPPGLKVNMAVSPASMEEEKGVPVRGQTGGAQKPKSKNTLVKSMVRKEINKLRSDLIQEQFKANIKIIKEDQLDLTRINDLVGKFSIELCQTLDRAIEAKSQYLHKYLDDLGITAEEFEGGNLSFFGEHLLTSDLEMTEEEKHELVIKLISKMLSTELSNKIINNVVSSGSEHLSCNLTFHLCLMKKLSDYKRDRSDQCIEDLKQGFISFFLQNYSINREFYEEKINSLLEILKLPPWEANLPPLK